MATTENEKRTPVFNWYVDQRGIPYGEFLVDPSGRVVTATEREAVEQIVIKAQATARGVYLIYADPENEENNHKYGSDVFEILRQELPESVRKSEVERAIKQALIYDPWVTDVVDLVVSNLGTEEATADFTVKTIFDRDIEVKGVPLNG